MVFVFYLGKYCFILFYFLLGFKGKGYCFGIDGFRGLELEEVLGFFNFLCRVRIFCMLFLISG